MSLAVVMLPTPVSTANVGNISTATLIARILRKQQCTVTQLMRLNIFIKLKQLHMKYYSKRKICAETVGDLATQKRTIPQNMSAPVSDDGKWFWNKHQHEPSFIIYYVDFLLPPLRKGVNAWHVLVEYILLGRFRAHLRAYYTFTSTFTLTRRGSYSHKGTWSSPNWSNNIKSIFSLSLLIECFVFVAFSLISHTHTPDSVCLGLISSFFCSFSLPIPSTIICTHINIIHIHHFIKFTRSHFNKITHTHTHTYTHTNAVNICWF